MTKLIGGKRKTMRNYNNTSKKTIKNKSNLKNNKKSKHTYQKRVVRVLLETLNVIKLYHWKTLSYPAHIATDKLHQKLSKHVDTYVEVMIGKTNINIQMKDFNNLSVKNIENAKSLDSYIRHFIDYFSDLHKELGKENGKGNNNYSDLLSIRDDIIADMNRFLYLLRLN